MHHILLQIRLNVADFKNGISAFVTAFVVAMIIMPFLIKLINRFKLFDVPDLRKEHLTPIPTMGGIASCIGMAVSCILWFRFHDDRFIISFFFSVCVLFIVGMMDDLRNISARYKLVIQIAVSLLIAFSGVRLTSLHGLLGIQELPITAQFTLTVLAITGITNAFNLIDGIDGLAGGLGFMSLLILGLFLTIGKDVSAVIAFALAGGLLGFLYYNFNPARIFMGDTGSLVLGFVVAVLCIKLLQFNELDGVYNMPHAPVFALSIVGIPVFDTLRVFSIRIWQGKSPFAPDKNHIHHLLTNNGWSHSFSAKLICLVHAFILCLGFFIKDLPQLAALAILLMVMLVMVVLFKRLKVPQGKKVVTTPG
ncbi:MAG TPA: MraY family glycosyltransferase [Flavisolibacter sp.]|nr:MraY family glycosyltransferase [Flavisolibacter sp.]